MPLYDYSCQCGKTFEDNAPIAECKEPADCDCGQKAKRIITFRRKGPTFSERLYPFFHDGIGETVYSGKHIDKRCAELGFVSPHEKTEGMTVKQELALMASRDRVNRFQNDNKHRKV